MSEASIRPYTHLISKFDYCNVLLEMALNTHLALEIHLVRKQFLSIDLRFQLLVIMVDSNVLKVSFDAIGDSFSKVFRLSSLKSCATKRVFGFDPLSVCFTEEP